MAPLCNANTEAFELALLPKLFRALLTICQNWMAAASGDSTSLVSRVSLLPVSRRRGETLGTRLTAVQSVWAAGCSWREITVAANSLVSTRNEKNHGNLLP